MQCSSAEARHFAMQALLQPNPRTSFEQELLALGQQVRTLEKAMSYTPRVAPASEYGMLVRKPYTGYRCARSPALLLSCFPCLVL